MKFPGPDGVTRAGTPDYPIWALPEAGSAGPTTGDIERATGIAVPIESIIEWWRFDDAYQFRVLDRDGSGRVVIDRVVIKRSDGSVY